MFTTLKKAMLMGVGVMGMTKDKVEEYAHKLIEESKVSEEEGQKFVDELLKKAEETRAEMEGFTKEQVQKVLEKLQVPSPEQFNALAKRVQELECQLKVKDDE